MMVSTGGGSDVSNKNYISKIERQTECLGDFVRIFFHLSVSANRGTKSSGKEKTQLISARFCFVTFVGYYSGKVKPKMFSI